jgi:NAD(P)H-quinone oxidoreductase subunit 6
MLVNKRQDFLPFPSAGLRKVFTALVSAGLFALLSTMIVDTPWMYAPAPRVGQNSTVMIGEHLFSDFLLPFELASILLLIAMVGAIILARREYLPDQSTPEQTILTLPERPRELVSTINNPDN